MWYPSRMRILLPLCVGALFAAPAKADKFWFSDPSQQTVEGAAPDMLEGVLLEEDAVSYHVRVVGGEVVIGKQRVFRIEKDGLTVEAIAAAEKDLQAKAKPELERQALARATARAERRAAEASARRTDVRAADASAPTAGQVRIPVEASFDPVVGVASPAVALSKAELQRELQAAWTLTKERRYLEALRKVRRLR